MPLTRSIKTESNDGQCDDLSELIPNLQWLSKLNQITCKRNRIDQF